MRTRDLKADRGLLPPKSLVTDKLRSLRKWRHWGRLRSLCHQYAARARRAVWRSTLSGASTGGRPPLNKRNSNGNRGSNSSARADNTRPVGSRLGRLDSIRNNRTGNNRGYSKGARAPSRGQKLRGPVPFHVVRTRLLGNIASPDMTASPMDTVAGLWGGELPAIDDPDALNELLRVVLMGLWNRLSRHQNRNAPFRMIRVDAPETREGLVNIAAIRREEVIGFIEGMFGKEQGLALPERARRALEALAEAGGLLRGVSEVADKAWSADDIAQTRRHISELTEICEREIHAALLSCTRARRRMPNSASTTKPTLH